MEENPKPPGASLDRSSSRLKQIYHRFLRSKSRAPVLAHSIKAADPSPAPSATSSAGPAASKTEATDKDTGASGDEGKLEKQKSKWGPGSVFRPVKRLFKAYVKFMMAPIPDEGALPGVGSGAEGYMCVTNSTPRHSLADRDRLYLETLRKEREKSGHLSTSHSQRSTPLHQRYYRPTQSGPLPASSRGHRPSRRYPISGPLPGTRLSREDSRRYSGELARVGDIQRRTSQELARDAIVGNPVVFGPAATPPPHPVDQGVASIAELDETPSIEGDSDGSGLMAQRAYVSKSPGRLWRVAEEAGTPRGVSLR